MSCGAGFLTTLTPPVSISLARLPTSRIGTHLMPSRYAAPLLATHGVPDPG